MSPELRDRIAADVIEAASDPEVVKKLTPMGQVVRPGTGARNSPPRSTSSAR